MRLLTSSAERVYVASADSIVAINTKNGSIKQLVCDVGKGSQIVTIAMGDGEKIFCGYANKQVVCWNAEGEQLGNYVHPKRPVGLALFHVEHPVGVKRDVLVAADKAGLISGTDFPKFSKTIPLAGHTSSVITDMVTDGKYIATADRDEKVRISEFPRLDTIQSFCLAHTDVITSVAFVEVPSSSTSAAQRLLVSCGWDYKIYLWDYMSGSVLDSIVCEGSNQKEGGDSSEAAGGGDGGGTADESAAGDAEAGDDDADANADADVDADGGADMAEKSYDEDAAGRFPIRLATSPNSPYVAVIFKNRAEVMLYKVDRGHSSSGSDTSTSGSAVGGFKFSEGVTYKLPVAPCDISFTEDSKLVVLLPKPHYMTVLKVSTAADSSLSLVNAEDMSGIVTSFQGFCANLDLDFSNQLLSAEDGADAERGMRKHALDRPFNKNTGIDFDRKKGAKRSRKRPAPEA